MSQRFRSISSRIMSFMAAVVLVAGFLFVPVEYKADDVTVTSGSGSLVSSYSWDGSSFSDYDTVTVSTGTNEYAFSRAAEASTYLELESGSYRLILNYNTNFSVSFTKNSYFSSYGTISYVCSPYFFVGDDYFYLNNSESAIFEFDFVGGYLPFYFGTDITVTTTYTSSSRTGTFNLYNVILPAASFSLYKVDDTASTFGDTDFYEPYYQEDLFTSGTASADTITVSAYTEDYAAKLDYSDFTTLNLAAGSYRLLYQYDGISYHDTSAVDMTLDYDGVEQIYHATYNRFSVGDDSFGLSDTGQFLLCEFETSGGYMPFTHSVVDHFDFTNQTSTGINLTSTLTIYDTTLYLYTLSDGSSGSVDDEVSAGGSGSSESDSESDSSGGSGSSFDSESNSWLENIYNSITDFFGGFWDNLRGVLNEDESESTEYVPPTEELDDSQMVEIGAVQDELLSGAEDIDLDNTLVVTLDSDVSGSIWHVIESFLNTHADVFGMIITSLSLGIVSLLLGR